MGYGGALIWAGLANNLKKSYPDKRVLFVYKRRIRDIISRRLNSDHVIYRNNSDIDMIIPKCKYLFLKRKFNKKDWIIVDMDNPELHYWEKETKEKIFFKRGRHTIEIMCEYFKIKSILLKPVLRLTNKESEKVKELLKNYNLKKKDFIVIEPNTKEAFTPNKKWFWDRWQKLVDLLTKEMNLTIVQVGAKNSPVLSGVINLAGLTSFRKVAGLIGEAKLFVGCEGGLMHAATAMNVKSVILVSGFEPQESICYPENTNIYKKVECAPCGLKIPCPYERKCMKEITVKEVYNSVLELIEQNE